MERVVNSVQQILTECNTMLAQAEHVEYLDVTSLATTLKSECEVLRQYYDLSPEDEYNIKKQKQVVERAALKLEEFMVIRLQLFKERFELRSFASQLYDDCRNLTRVMCQNNASDSELIQWGAYTNWALNFYARSLHVLFFTDTDDDKQIRTIVDNYKIQKERWYKK